MRSTPRTMCWRGWRTSSAYPRQRAGSSCREARSATSRRSSPRVITPTALDRPTAAQGPSDGWSWRAPRRTLRSRAPRKSWTSTWWRCRSARAACCEARAFVRHCSSTARRSSPSWQRAGRRISALSTTSPRSLLSKTSLIFGCTLTARMALPRLLPTSRGPDSRALSAQTRSLSTRTSGCSRRSTRARCSIATPRSRASRTHSTPNTWMP